MKLAFLGSGEFGLVSLEALLVAGFDVVLVVTQPPRRRRRKASPEPTPVQRAAEVRAIPVVAPVKVNTPESLDALRDAGADLFVVSEYGQILSQELLDIPRFGAINVHSSLLPRHRGATPVSAAILAGDDETGVTIQRVVRALDAGAILAQKTTPIGADETAGELSARLAVLGGEAVVDVVAAFARGAPPAGREQDEAGVTVCRRLATGDSEIDWTKSAAEVARHVRAMTPKPGARTAWSELLLVIRRGEAVPGAASAGVVAEGFDIGCGGGGLYRVAEVVPQSKRPMAARDFLNGYRLRPGERLG